MTVKVLIVDDSRVSRMMIKARIQAFCPDWVCAEAASGDEAVANLDEVSPDFVTMDMNMPGLTGFDAAQKIWELAPSVKIAMMTANIQESSRTRADSMGLKFVQKPITDASIREVIDYFSGAK